MFHPCRLIRIRIQFQKEPFHPAPATVDPAGLLIVKPQAVSTFRFGNGFAVVAGMKTGSVTLNVDPTVDGNVHPRHSSATVIENGPE
jgi:hypothetical protein